MSLAYVQSDTVAPAGTIAACSGAAVQNAVARLAALGGSAGSTQVTSTPRNVRASAMMEFTPAADVVWNAGSWSIPWNVTNANANATLEEVHVCRLNSSNVSQATIGSTTGIGTALSSTGVITTNVTGSAQTPSAGDKVYIVFVFDTNGSPQAIGWTPDQTITTPFTLPASNPWRPAVARIHAVDLMIGNLGRHHV